MRQELDVVRLKNHFHGHPLGEVVTILYILDAESSTYLVEWTGGDAYQSDVFELTENDVVDRQ